MKLSKLKEFASIDDLNKFYTNGNVLFSNGKPAYNFWKHYKNEILNSNDKYSKRIKEQFWIYDNKHLIEFANEMNLDKFNDSKNKLKFSDGTDMSRWFRTPGLKEKILESKDKYSIKVQNDYVKYKKRKIIEFIAISDLDKFSSTTNLTFSDDSKVKGWWRTYKNDILSSYDQLSIEVQNQYIDYKSKTFLERLHEFLLMDNDIKFKNTLKQDVCFTDGSGVYSWYSHYRNDVKNVVNEMIKIYERQNNEVPNCLLNKNYLDKDMIKKYKL